MGYIVFAITITICIIVLYILNRTTKDVLSQYSYKESKFEVSYIFLATDETPFVISGWDSLRNLTVSTIPYPNTNVQIGDILKYQYHDDSTINVILI